MNNDSSSEAGVPVVRFDPRHTPTSPAEVMPPWIDNDLRRRLDRQRHSRRARRHGVVDRIDQVDTHQLIDSNDSLFNSRAIDVDWCLRGDGKVHAEVRIPPEVSERPLCRGAQQAVWWLWCGMQDRMIGFVGRMLRAVWVASVTLFTVATICRRPDASSIIGDTGVGMLVLMASRVGWGLVRGSIGWAAETVGHEVRLQDSDELRVLTTETGAWTGDHAGKALDGLRLVCLRRMSLLRGWQTPDPDSDEVTDPRLRLWPAVFAAAVESVEQARRLHPYRMAEITRLVDAVTEQVDGGIGPDGLQALIDGFATWRRLDVEQARLEQDREDAVTGRDRDADAEQAEQVRLFEVEQAQMVFAEHAREHEVRMITGAEAVRVLTNPHP